MWWVHFTWSTKFVSKTDALATAATPQTDYLLETFEKADQFQRNVWSTRKLNMCLSDIKHIKQLLGLFVVAQISHLPWEILNY